jgi:16S rRNA (guanine527-N7)-methyltransferase
MARLRAKEGFRLGEVACSLKVPLPRAAEEHLVLWLERLVEWNTRVDMTAARDPSEFVDLMVADAMVLSEQVPTGAKVIDVGTGAGAPGLALAFLRPDLAVTLVEPLAKRSAFLRTVVGVTGRLDVAIEGNSGEVVAQVRGQSWDVGLARATLPPADWLALAPLLLVPGGSAWLFLARDVPPTVPGMHLAGSLTYAWPLTGAERRLVRYTKDAEPSTRG